ncbi:hypothetical protein Hanom_Chr06g00569981 [Helianthus anomalus]
MEPRVSLEAGSLFLRGRGKVFYILPSSDPTLALLLVGFTKYDDDELTFDESTYQNFLNMPRLRYAHIMYICVGARGAKVKVH